MTGQLGSPQIWGREHQGGLCLWFELLGSGSWAGGKLPSGLARIETLGDKHAASDLNMKIVMGVLGAPGDKPVLEDPASVCPRPAPCFPLA